MTDVVVHLDGELAWRCEDDEPVPGELVARAKLAGEVLVSVETFLGDDVARARARLQRIREHLVEHGIDAARIRLAVL